MIKGSVEERLEYEEYIRSLKDSIRYPFWGIYWESQKIIRYYWIKKAKENREFTSNEIQILHLMSLIDVAVRIGGLLYAWWWEEYIPKIISTLSPSKAEWYISPEDVTQCFLNVPTKTVEAALLKTNASSVVVRKALDAQKSDNRDMLLEQMSCVSLDEIFGAYKLINAYRQQCELISEIRFSDSNAERKTLYTLSDAFEVVNGDSVLVNQPYLERISDLARIMELDEENIVNNPDAFIFALCIGIQLIREISNDRLGKYDPIAETIQKITKETAFEKIYHQYVKLPRDTDRCLAACGKFINWLNENFEIAISMDELDMETLPTKNNVPVKYSNSLRLPFPTRLISATDLPISAQEQEQVLRNLYDMYGGSFESMSYEEFLYLFGSAFSKKPASYNPPYYWTGDESTMKALLRILYTQQPRIFKTLILHISDKESGAKSHNWSRNKDKVAYRDIEANIIKMVHQDTGKTLKEL